MVTFLYMFYAFCWREEVAGEKRRVKEEEEEEAEEAWSGNQGTRKMNKDKD